MGVLEAIALAAALSAAVSWLVVSLSQAGRRRSIVEWVATISIYVALCAFFLNLSRSAWLDSRTVALVAFGLLATIFGAGTILSAVKLVGEIRGSRSRDLGATS